MQHCIDCECGGSIIVAETAAGTSVLCRCGRSVEVPSLRELRYLAGLPGSDPPSDLLVESLLLAKKLPEEDRHSLWRCH